MSTSQTAAATQCAGNIVVGLSGTGIRFSYFIRLTGAAVTATTTRAVAYIIDMSTGATLARADVTALMPTVANQSYTQVTARVSASPRLLALRSYWLAFCFNATTRVTTRGVEESSIEMGGSNSGRTTVGVCSGGPPCLTTGQEGTLSTVISHTATSDSSGDSSDIGIVAIAAGVAVPVVLAVAGLVACVVAYIAYTRSKGRLGQLPPARRRSSLSLEREVHRLHDNDLFEMDTFARSHQLQLNRESWMTS